MRPHRAGMILGLGIASFVCCGPVLGPIAFFMGRSDLAAMDSGLMDPSGRGMTNAGKICGLVSTILSIFGLILWVVLMALGLMAGNLQPGGGP